MPWVALNKETNERYDLTEIEQPRNVIPASLCVCPLCHGPMILKSGVLKRPHFAHRIECTSTFAHHPESPEHLFAKSFLKQQIPIEFPQFREAKFELEVVIPEVNRVADVLATFPTGHRVAHEVQLSPITIEQLQERTNDYARAGIAVTWWLGHHANTPANCDWVLQNFGELFCFTSELRRR